MNLLRRVSFFFFFSLSVFLQGSFIPVCPSALLPKRRDPSESFWTYHTAEMPWNGQTIHQSACSFLPLRLFLFSSSTANPPRFFSCVFLLLLLLITSLARRFCEKAVTGLSSSSSFSSSSSSSRCTSFTRASAGMKNKSKQPSWRRRGTASETFVWRSRTFESRAWMCVWEKPSVFFIMAGFLKSQRPSVSSLSSSRKWKRCFERTGSSWSERPEISDLSEDTRRIGGVTQTLPDNNNLKNNSKKMDVWVPILFSLKHTQKHTHTHWPLTANSTQSALT